MNKEKTEVIRMYLAWAQNTRGKAMATLKAEKADLERFTAWLNQEQIDFDQVSAADLRRFLDGLAATSAASSQARLVSTLRAFFEFLDVRYDIPDPSALLKGPKKPSHLPLWLTGHEMDELMETFEPDGRHPDQTIVMTLFCTGLRVSELCSLQLRDVRLDQQQIRVTGKGGKERLIPLAQACVSAMSDYLDCVRPVCIGASDPGSFFVTAQGKPVNRQYVYRLIKKHARKAGMNEELSPHSLRHSFASRLLESDVDLRMVQELLGHSDISTTQIYTHLDGKRLKQTIDHALPAMDLNPSGNQKGK